MGSRVACVMGFLLVNVQLATPFQARLTVRNGTDRQTDGQTMVINALCATPRGRGIKQYCCCTLIIKPENSLLSVFLFQKKLPVCQQYCDVRYVTRAEVDNKIRIERF